MPFTIKELDIRTELPDLPGSAPLAVSDPPCLKDRHRSVPVLSEHLGFEVRGTAEVPHGVILGSDDGQVELFAASGAVRARSTARLSAYADERREWADLERQETEGGIVHVLGDKTARRLTEQSLHLLDAAGLAVEPARIDVVLEQWARLDEEGTELESGPGRATVRLAYAAEGLPLLGAGAKTNLHLDPDGDGEGGLLARMLHVHRGVAATRDVPLLGVEEALAPILRRRTWSGADVGGGSARMSLTSVVFGLLALPADVVQQAATPVLAVEGRIEGATDRRGREVSLRFAEYVPLVSDKALAEAGFATAGPLVPGQLVRRRTSQD
jgi:hypothetical protein